MAKKKNPASIVDKKLKELHSLKDKIRLTQEEVVKTIFTQYPKLQSIELDASEEYDDNNYYTRVTIRGFNGVEFGDGGVDCVDSLDYIAENNDEFKGALVEMGIKRKEVEEIIDQLFCLEEDYLKEFDQFNREEMLK